MAEYVNQSNKFLLRGMNNALPSDRLGVEWAQLMKNLRSYRVGEWQQRPGLSLIADVDGGSTAGIWFAKRISNNNAGTYRRLVATADGKVYVDDAAHTSFSLVDSGYSSNPYTSIIARPDRSPLPYLFLANDTRLGKFDVLGNRTEWGLSAPLVAPTAELARNAYKVIDDCESAAGFTGTGGAVSAVARASAVAISQILFDTGTTGWACVVPATLDTNWQEGMFITTSANVETVIIESIYQQIASTTIGSILYDSGTSGLCTIQLATPTAGLQRNSIIRLNATENVRVLSVTMGLDGIPSLRCSTSGTFSAGQTVDGFRSFRAYFSNNHTTAETLSTNYVQLAVAGSGLSSVSKTAALDLTSTNVGATRPVQASDYVHVSILVSDFSLVSEIQIQFDCDSTTNDFTKNYYFKSIRQPDLLAAVKQTSSSLTAQQTAIQRQQIDEFRRQQLLDEKAYIESQNLDTGFAGIGQFRRDRLDEINSQLGDGFLVNSGQGALSESGIAGSGQWTELKIPITEFQRVGSDTSRGWKDIKAFAVTVNATAAVNVGVDALWIGGSYGADFSIGQTTSPSSTGALDGYTYVYRARNSSTGSRSNPSPPMRSPVYPEREAVSVTIPSGYADAQADFFDLYRIGGSLGAYHYVASIPSGSLTYTDTLPDDIVVTQPMLEFDRFKPWPRIDTPKSGTCDVAGTKVKFTGGFVANAGWLRGTQIIINQQAYTFYSNPTTAGGVWYVELNESAGTLSGVSFQIPEPQLDGQALPVVVGPYGGGVSGEFIHGCGDPVNPGYWYWTNGNDPESVGDANYLELCSPSEVLMNGAILDGIIYAFSNQRSWRILPSFSGGQSGGGSDFYAQETAIGKGLAGRWGLTVGDQIYFVSFDGIYATKGDVPRSLTDDALSPIFRRDGSTYNANVIGYLSPVSFDSADEKYISLTYSKDGLYFTYKGIDGNRYNLYYSFLTQGWMYDTFTPTAQRMFREEGLQVDTVLMGSTTGKFYYMTQTSQVDDGSGILCSLVTREEDWGDTRGTKMFGDCTIDCVPGGNTLSGTLLIDNNTSTQVLDQTMTGTTRQRFVRGVPFGADKLVRSVALQLNWTTSNGNYTYLYEWNPAALPKPVYTDLRSTDWDTAGYDGPKWVQGMRLTCDTGNLPKDITIQYDEGLTGAILSDVTHNGEVTKEYSWLPFIAHQVRIVTTDNSVNWRFFRVEWIVEPEPASATRWDIQSTSLDLPAFSHVADIMICHRSTTDLTLEEIVDGASVTYTIPNSAASVRRSYIRLQARKGKMRKYVVTSTDPFAIYLKDLALRVGAWGRTGEYVIIRPFGDVSRSNGGARI